MNNLRKIVLLSKPLHWGFILVSILILLESLINQAFPIIIKFLVDEVEQQLTTGTGSLERIFFLIGVLIVVGIISELLISITQRFGDYLASRLGKFLTEKFYRKIFTLPQSYFDTELSGKIVNQLTRGILTIQDFLSSTTNFILPAVGQTIVSIGILAYYDPLIALLATIIFPYYIGISHYSTQRWGKREVEKNQIEDIYRGRIQEVIANIKLVKTFNTKLYEWGFVSQQYQQSNQIYDRQSTDYHILNFLRNLGLTLIISAIIGISVRNTFNGVITLGSLVLILQVLNQLRRPLFAMSFILERIQRAEAGSREYFQVMEAPSVEKWEKRIPKAKFKKPHLRFDRVSFRYEDDEVPVLEEVSFNLDKQETVALVGHSGAGKSTILNLILKLYQPTEGEIYLNDSAYSKLSHAQVREHISLVLQDNELFSTTVRENVAYGLKDVSDKQIIKALKQAHAWEFVSKFAGGLDEKIGERGVKLSGGQKQRIQIARAILRNAPILILDEATSSLDSKSEKLVQEALDNLYRDKLVIIVAHRFSTLQNADRIIVIDQGKVVDSGASSELAKKDGIYAELLRYQVEGNQKLLQQFDLVEG